MPSVKYCFVLLALTLTLNAIPSSMSKNSYAHPELKGKIKNSRVLVIPGDSALGTLQYMIEGSAAHGRSMRAQGTIEVPGDEQITLEPSQFLLSKPELINGLLPTISGIKIRSIAAVPLLDAIEDKEAIQALRFDSIGLSPSLITTINSFPNLKFLTFDHPVEQSAHLFNGIKAAQNLETLRVADSMVAPALKQIKGSKALKKLEVSGATLNKGDFEMLQKLPLHFLSIQKCQFEDSAIELLPRFAQLRILWLGEHDWTPKAVAPLKKMGFLQELHLRVYVKDLASLTAVHDALPHTIVN